MFLSKSKRARIVWVGSCPISAAYLHTFTAFIVFTAPNAPTLEIFPLSRPHTKVCHFKDAVTRIFLNSEGTISARLRLRKMKSELAVKISFRRKWAAWLTL